MKKLTTLQRVAALTLARDNAQDPDFKLVWDMKLRHLIKMAERGETSWVNITTELKNND